MDSKHIIVAVLVPVAVLLIGALLCLCYKKGWFRKSVAATDSDSDLKLLLKSKNKIAFNAQMIEELKVLTENLPNMLPLLEELQEVLRYLSPSTLEAVTKIDDEIRLVLESFRTDCNNQDISETLESLAQMYVKKVRVLIAQRSAYTNR